MSDSSENEPSGPVFHGMDFIETQDPDSPQAQASQSWIENHQTYLPPTGEVVLSDVDFERYRSVLATPFSSEENIEEALMVLGHEGTKRAIDVLKDYQNSSPPTEKLKTWTELALSECRKFYKNLSEGVGPTLTIQTVEDDAVSPDESITVFYDPELQKITGTPYDRIPIDEPGPFLVALKTVFEFYPQIEETYPPGKLGIKVNGSPPTVNEMVNPGSEIRLQATPN